MQIGSDFGELVPVQVPQEVLVPAGPVLPDLDDPPLLQATHPPLQAEPGIVHQTWIGSGSGQMVAEQTRQLGRGDPGQRVLLLCQQHIDDQPVLRRAPPHQIAGLHQTTRQPGELPQVHSSTGRVIDLVGIPLIRIRRTHTSPRSLRRPPSAERVAVFACDVSRNATRQPTAMTILATVTLLRPSRSPCGRPSRSVSIEVRSDAFRRSDSQLRSLMSYPPSARIVPTQIRFTWQGDRRLAQQPAGPASTPPRAWIPPARKTSDSRAGISTWRRCRGTARPTRNG